MTIRKELRETIESAISAARTAHHEYVTLEHLLLALCDDPMASKVLQAVGADLEALARELGDFLSQQSAIVPAQEGEEIEPKQTLSFWRVSRNRCG